MDIKVGDRFRYKHSPEIWESTVDENSSSECIVVCVDASGNPRCNNGEIEEWSFAYLKNSAFWTYLGNFAKSRNFSNLYSIISDDDIL